MRNIIIIILIIFCCLLFAWWASGEIYNPRPTPPANTQIVLPPKATATNVPAATAVIPVTEIVAVTEAPVPTATFTPTLVFTATQAPTYTQIPTQVIISTPVLSFIVHDDCYTVLYNVFRIIYRNSTCSNTELYKMIERIYERDQGHPAPPGPPHGTIIP